MRPTAADAKRWNGVRSVVQARALLKTLFRSASQHKAQVSKLGRSSLATFAWLGLSLM